MSTLTKAIQTVVENMLLDLHTCIPGRIEKYDYIKQLAEVKPLIRQDYNDDTTESMPVIANVPVMFPRTKKSIIHFPLVKGDYVLILFSERAMEKWLSLGGEAESGDKRKYDLSDAIAIPGLLPFSEPSLAENNEDLLVKHNDSIVRIKKNGDIDIGESSFKNLMTEDIIAKFNQHTHGGVTSGSAFTGNPTVSTPSTTYTSADATQKVKVQ